MAIIMLLGQGIEWRHLENCKGYQGCQMQVTQLPSFKIIASNFHCNVHKYMIFVTKVVVNLHFRDGEFNVRIWKSFIGSIARLAFPYTIS